MNDGDNLDRPAPVTREEYAGLLQRIEALEAKLRPYKEAVLADVNVESMIMVRKIR